MCASSSARAGASGWPSRRWSRRSPKTSGPGSSASRRRAVPAFHTRSRTAKARSSPGCRPTARPRRTLGRARRRRVAVRPAQGPAGGLRVLRRLRRRGLRRLARPFRKDPPMKLLILSDLHLEFAPFEPAADLVFDVVILAGDIHSPAKRAIEWAMERFPGKPVVYVARQPRVLRRPPGQDPGRGAQRGRRQPCAPARWRRAASIDGVRFLGRDALDRFRARDRGTRRAGQRRPMGDEAGDQRAERLRADPHVRRDGRTRQLAAPAGPEAPGGRHAADPPGPAGMAAGEAR